MADTWERGGDVHITSRKGYSFDVPDYTDEIVALKTEAGLKETILKIIEKHKPHRARLLMNYKRYKTDITGVPIFSRSF